MFFILKQLIEKQFQNKLEKNLRNIGETLFNFYIFFGDKKTIKRKRMYYNIKQ